MKKLPKEINMINQKFLNQLKADYRDHESERRQIGAAANNLLFAAKKIIFALQRKEFAVAEKKLAETKKTFQDLEKRFDLERLNREGSYRAAAEEYLEAQIFLAAAKGKTIVAESGLNLDYESYLGGLCDLIGELVRYATNQAAAGQFSVVNKIKEQAETIMAQLVDFDLTGYLRTKYDQARGHLRKLEQMAYEIRLRGEK